MKLLTTCLCLAALSLPAGAESLTYKDARKILPKANARPVITLSSNAVPESDREQLEGARQKLDDVLNSIGKALPAYGALAISPSEGLFVDWLNGTGQFHSAEAARDAALKYCDGKRKSGSEKCVVIVEVAPKGADADASLKLSGAANAALRKDYRRLDSPKAFAISDSTGNFGFAKGDGARAIDACASVGDGAADCRVVVAD